MNSKGQALVESLLATSVLITLCGGALLMAYLCFARLWIQYQLERSVVCAAISDPHKCVRNLDKRIQATLPFGKWQSKSWSLRENYYVKATYQLTEVKWQWQRKLEVEKIGKKARQRLPW